MSKARWSIIAFAAVIGCDGAVDSDELATALEPPAHTDFALARAREDEKLADDVEHALSQRWPSIAELVQDCPRPLLSSEDVLHERGLADLEAGLPRGVFSDEAARSRYFAALFLGWTTEPSALRIAARVESRRLASLSAAGVELPDVDQRLAVDALARAASDCLHTFCQRLAALGGSCLDSPFERSIELGARSPG